MSLEIMRIWEDTPSRLDRAVTGGWPGLACSLMPSTQQEQHIPFPQLLCAACAARILCTGAGHELCLSITAVSAPDNTKKCQKIQSSGIQVTCSWSPVSRSELSQTLSMLAARRTSTSALMSWHSSGVSPGVLCCGDPLIWTDFGDWYLRSHGCSPVHQHTHQ